MLGRLRMSFDECEDAYLNLSESIFTARRARINIFGKSKDFLKADGKFDAQVLENAIKDQIRAKSRNIGGDASNILLKKSSPHCKVYCLNPSLSHTVS